MTEQLAAASGQRLLTLARETIGHRLGLVEAIDCRGLENDDLRQALGTFVTLSLLGSLRGCIGNLEQEGTVVESVGRNALAAAFHDHRFAPLQPDEFDLVHIGISVLGETQPLEYQDGDELLDLLRPGIDGIILRSGRARATFLPQVWSQLPEPGRFLEHLCLKAGLSRLAWRELHPEIMRYQVQCFGEDGT